MTQSELIKIQTSAIRKKQILDVLRLRIPYGEMGVYQRMQTEVFLKNIHKIADILRDIETCNDIMDARDLIKGLNTSPDKEENQVIRFILDMLEEMGNAIVYTRQVQFDTIKENLIIMLEDDMKDIIA